MGSSSPIFKGLKLRKIFETTTSLLISYLLQPTMAPEKLPKPNRKGLSSNHQFLGAMFKIGGGVTFGTPKTAWVCVNVSLFPILGIFGFPWKMPPPLSFGKKVGTSPYQVSSV